MDNILHSLKEEARSLRRASQSLLVRIFPTLDPPAFRYGCRIVGKRRPSPLAIDDLVELVPEIEEEYGHKYLTYEFHHSIDLSFWVVLRVML
jgi:hypothetical protein